MFRVDYSAECVNEDMIVVPVAETPFQLIQVPAQVLGADLVESSDDAALINYRQTFVTRRYSRSAALPTTLTMRSIASLPSASVRRRSSPNAK